MIAAFRRARIRHLNQRIAALGAATLVAQFRRDWKAAGRFLEQMHAAQATRDALQHAPTLAERVPLRYLVIATGLLALVFFLTH